jgi:ferredoxin
VQKNFLPNDSLPLFLEGLAASGELHGPVLTDDGVLAFRPVGSAAQLRLDYQRTLIPPKKYLLPPRETMLSFSPDAGYRLPEGDVRHVVLFGIHSCDLAGIAYLDRLFLESVPDPLYRLRREALVLVGLSCEADEFCFCGNVGVDRPTAFDLFMERTDEGYHLSSGSARGDELMVGLDPLLEMCESPPSPPAACDIEETILQAASKGETFPDSPCWDDFADRCLACGACSLCCPTCYCFDVREYGGLDGGTAQRLREWDNCLFRTHGEVAGGYNFRKSRQERFHYRYRHKYLGFGPVRGVMACVGCGRCREACPVQIDLLELFKHGS